MRIAQSLIADQLKVLKTIMPPKASGLLEAILVKDSYLIADNFDYTIGTLVPVQMDAPFVLPKKAIKMGRRGYGVELNPDYYRDGLGYLEEAEAEIEQPTLFDFIGGAG